jgi:hypothetical protein
MSRFRFKAGDFKEKWSLGQIAIEANKILDEHLNGLTRVYGCRPIGEESFYFNYKRIAIDTHTALLWDLEEIKPEKCSHDTIKFTQNKSDEGICQDCGARLVRKWQEVEG